MNFVYTLCLALIGLCFFSCQTSNKIRDGQAAYDMKQYAVAIPLLKKEGETASRPEIKAAKFYVIGQCYTHLLDYPKALEYFSLAEKYSYGVDATLQKAFILKNLMKYDLAISSFESLRNITSLQQEVKKQIAICTVLKETQSQIPQSFLVEKMWSESYYSDYGAVTYDDDFLVVTSDREESTGGDRYKWTGNKFSDLFMVDKESKSVKRFDSVINTEANEGTPTFTTDYQTMIFTRCFAISDDKHEYCKLMISSRIDGIWADPKVLPLCRPNINYGQPCLIENDSVLVFSASMPGGNGGYDLWYAEWDGLTWSNPFPLPPNINTAYNEHFPAADGDTLYFSSDNDNGFGGLDLYKTWLRSDGSWENPVLLPYPYNSGADDFSLVVDRTAPKPKSTMTQGYFSSSRGNKGVDELYLYRIYTEKQIEVVSEEKQVTTPSNFDIYLALKVVTPIYKNDNPNGPKSGKATIQFAQVVLKDGGMRTQFKTDKNGLVLANLVAGKTYEIVAGKDSFLVNKIDLSTLGLSIEEGETSITLNKEMELARIFRGKEIILENIYYEYDKWYIRDDAKPTLDALSLMLKSNPDIRIELGSHTDCRGDNAYNEILSQKRAQSAVDYLVAKGIEASRLTAQGYGEAYLADTCVCDLCTEAQHQINRRTTFKIL
ncbi:MAG: OmpA family protein [Saprospiraceae bacterium]|nr:OmpA family protein [Saprospiraceae bacterium]